MKNPENRTSGFRTSTVQSTSENRMFGFQTTLKSERSIVRLYSVRISNVGSIGVRISAFYSIGSKLTKIRTFEHVWSYNRTSEIRTKSFGFRHFLQPNRNWKRTEGTCLKSECVRISDIYCSFVSTMIMCIQFICIYTHLSPLKTVCIIIILL